MARFFNPRQRAVKAGYEGDLIGKRSFMRGYQDGYESASSPPFPPRPVAYGKGYAAGKADAEAFLAAARQLEKPARHATNAREGVASFKAALKNVNRTTTRRLDEANMPRDMQGNDGKDWG